MKATANPIALIALASLCFPGIVFANMSYTPWVHQVIQKGPDMEITVSVFDQTTATNNQSQPLPGLEAAYSLFRTDWEDRIPLFENRVFDPAEAVGVTEYTCQSWGDAWLGDICAETDTCVDCDEDGTNECYGFCGVAYRYKVVDFCPPPEQELYYGMFTSTGYDLAYENEGLGFTTSWAENTGDACLDADDETCSVGRVGRTTSSATGLGGILRAVAVALGFI